MTADDLLSLNPFRFPSDEILRVGEVSLRDDLPAGRSQPPLLFRFLIDPVKCSA
ncbi:MULTISPECIES: hypothetical protein [unclassified Rathayibacter]|uniref:hypothetical protein n=1 Tax=unclassified Rathayibacter TaxID=2609250 RepID=UPI0015E3477F|nr:MULTISPECIES: hypothetical protein [unclassified Rathayibacter]